MTAQRTPRLTYANVMSTLAMFVALGGVSYAAVTLPKNSVGAAQIKKGAVTPSKLSKSTLTTLAGKTGPAGAPGAPGANGTNGVTNVTHVTGTSVTVGSGATVPATVQCPTGQLAVGGGGGASTSAGMVLASSFPIDATGSVSTGVPQTGWKVTYTNTTGSPVFASAQVACAG